MALCSRIEVQKIGFFSGLFTSISLEKRILVKLCTLMHVVACKKTINLS